MTKHQPTAAPFGHLPSGEAVEAWTIANAGITLKVITYGGIITELHVPDAKGVVADVVLGFSKLESYLAAHPYFGCITGRVAGRITGGTFTLDSRKHQLAINDPPNHLHGGLRGLDKRLWKAESAGRASVRLTYLSPNGEEGYPGNVHLAVTYSLTEDRALRIDYEATTDQTTPLSLTNHSYFNLAGEGNGTILEHQLEIFTEHYVPTDEFGTLLGVGEPVDGRGCDFRKPRRIGDALPAIARQHGDNYLFQTQNNQTLNRVARVFDPASGRMMEVLSTERCLQFYSGLYLDGTLTGKSGRSYARHAALCLEAQGYPDGINTPALGDITLRPGQTYRQTTVYRFSTPALNSNK
jgi:aldose 1-epimerase